jgi:AraC family L-rhamnose operon regulatory protein RhaS
LRFSSAKNIEQAVNPHRREPIYHSGGVRYAIDTCRPQIEAARQGKISLHALSKGHYPGTPMKPLVLPGLNSIGFWDGAGPQDWGLEAHRNEGIEVCFLETGAMAFTVDQRRFDLHAGSLTITRPWQLHKLGAPNIGPGRLHWLILDVGVRRPNQQWRWPPWVMLQAGDLAELTRKLRHNENPVWPATHRVAGVFRDLAQLVLNWAQPHCASRMAIEINQLLVELLGFLSCQEIKEQPELTSRQRTVELFLNDLAKNPISRHGPWTLDEMAAHCGKGVTAITKYCHELVNSGPVEFMNKCRLDHAARQLVENPARTVTEIAFEHGFSSSQYFATAFRRQFHVAPLDYRAQAASPDRRHKLEPAPGRTASRHARRSTGATGRR